MNTPKDNTLMRPKEGTPIIFSQLTNVVFFPTQKIRREIERKRIANKRPKRVIVSILQKDLDKYPVCTYIKEYELVKKDTLL